MSYGYEAQWWDLQAPTNSGSKFYRVWQFYNKTTGDARLLLNWGKLYARGQYKVEMGWGATNKVNAKIKSGYRLIDRGADADFTDSTLLREAGINAILAREQAREQPRNENAASTPVELAGLARFTQDVAVLMARLERPFEPEVIVEFASLREQLVTIQTQVQEAEGQMEILTALVHAKFEEAS